MCVKKNGKGGRKSERALRILQQQKHITTDETKKKKHWTRARVLNEHERPNW